MAGIRGGVVGTILVAGIVTVGLSSCSLIGSLVPASAGDEPVGLGPEGWSDLGNCVGGPNTDFRWIDGIPSEELARAGVFPDCGDSWVQADGDSFVGVADYTLTADQLAALDRELTKSGWTLRVDDFEPVASADAPRSAVGARDYYTDDDERLLAIELYHNGTNPISYTAYIDYHSPETRALK